MPPLEGGRLRLMLREQYTLSARYARAGDHRQAWSSLASAVERFFAGAVDTPEQEALHRLAAAVERLEERGVFVRSRQP